MRRELVLGVFCAAFIGCTAPTSEEPWAEPGDASDDRSNPDKSDAAVDVSIDSSAESDGRVADACPDASLLTMTLLDLPGAVFTPTPNETMRKYSAGAKGTVYSAVRVQFDVLAGDWQPEVPDEGNPDRTEHILFGLFRANQTKSDLRYLMGSAAVTFANKGPQLRMFGRTSIGAGYTTYVGWGQSYGWQKGTLYHLDCSLDGVADIQVCKLSITNTVEKTLTGTVAYLDPVAHLSSGFYVELGQAPIGDIETAPIGWTYSNLLVTATTAQ